MGTNCFLAVQKLEFLLNFFILVGNDALWIYKVTVDVQDFNFVVFIMNELADDEGDFLGNVASCVMCCCCIGCPKLDVNGVLEGSVAGFCVHVVVGGVGDIVVVVLGRLATFNSSCCWRKVRGGEL